MSAEAVEVARRIFDTASRIKDPSGRRVDLLDSDTAAAVFDWFDPEIEMREDPSFPEAGTYRGVDAIRKYLADFSQSFDEFAFDVEDFVDLGDDRVLVLFRIHSKGTGSGAIAEARPGWIYTIRGEKVTRIEAYLDRDEALAAAGVGPRTSESSA
jgi:ketosteroid isomerase-like protein